MPFVVFRGERRLTDIVRRSFGELENAAERRRARDAVLRANPHLENLADVPLGSLIVVPRVPGIRPVRRGRVDDPGPDAVGEVADALAFYVEHLRAAGAEDRRRLDEVDRLLEDQALVELLSEVQVAERWIGPIAQANQTRRAEADERDAFIERLSGAAEELEDLKEFLR
jgi:hypothetical protein